MHTIFKCIVNAQISIKISPKFDLKVPIEKIPALFR